LSEWDRLKSGLKVLQKIFTKILHNYSLLCYSWMFFSVHLSLDAGKTRQCVQYLLHVIGGFRHDLSERLSVNISGSKYSLQKTCSTMLYTTRTYLKKHLISSASVQKSVDLLKGFHQKSISCHSSYKTSFHYSAMNPEGLLFYHILLLILVSQMRFI
jgi:hypothetical protein